MANSVEFEFAAALQSVFYTCAKYVLEHKETLAETTEEELVSAFSTACKTPRPPIGTTIGMMAPSLSGPVGFGGVQPLPAKATRTKAKSAKDAPAPEWIELAEYTKRKDEGQKVCAYYCERSADLNQKDRICAAKCDDRTEGVEDCLDWRCITHKDKQGVIKKKINGTTKTITPNRTVPGVNVPPGPMPSLPIKPLPIGSGLIGNMSVPPPMASIAGLPTMLPTGPVIPASKAPTPKKVPTPKKLEPIPTPIVDSESEAETLPTQEVMSSLPAMAELPGLPSLPPAPVEEEPLPTKPDWLAVSGLTMHYTVSNCPGFKKILFKFDTTQKKMVALGRINGDINAHAMTNLMELNSKEQEFVLKTMSEKMNTPTDYKFEAPGIPGLPTIPGLP